MKIINFIIIGIISAGLFHLASCGSGSSSDAQVSATGSTASSTTGSFPSSVVITSPTENSELVSSSHLISSSVGLGRTVTPAEAYNTAVERINDLLSGETPLLDTFTPNLFYTADSKADCFGPKLLYENHPDGSDGTPQSGDLYPSLPTGDLGIWLETEDGTEACAAAQLNARMEGLRVRSYIALSTVASIVYVYVDAGNTWPDDVTAGSTIDLTTEMNALSVADTTFTSATMAKDATTNLWTYNAQFAYTIGTDTFNVEVQLEHFYSETDDYSYEGLLSFKADGNESGGNCTTTDDVTINGSLHYVRNSETSMVLQSRGVEFCNHGTDGLTVALSDIYSDTNLNGYVVTPDITLWANNFHYFTADYDPTSSNLAGHYSYTWQAGPQDGYSRIIDIGINASTSDGETYYGYGASVENMSPLASPYYGEISGFICNWAGPGHSHSIVDKAQRQHITQNTSGVYEPTNTGASDITYAPTNSCEYDGSGSFLYDRDIDADLIDETSATVNVYGGETLEMDFMEPSGTATTIWEHITNNRGYNLPDYP